MAEGSSEPRIVAIDGPAGVGKSTVSRRLAERLGLPVLDTGAMYRAVALEILEKGIDPDDRDAAVAVATSADVAVKERGDDVVVCLDGEPVGERIRTPEVTDATSRISVYPEVRRRLVELQRRAARRFGAVVEGRDIGTVVFPETPHKFYLDARTEVRAARRLGDLDGDVSFDEVRLDLERRDARDAGREDSPLSHDDSYHVIDTSDLSADDVVERMLEVIEGGS